MTLFLDCGGDNDGSLSTRPRSTVLLARLRTKSSDNWVSAESIAFDVIRGAMAEFTSGTLLPGGGGSAMP